MQTGGEERKGEDDVIFGEHPFVILPGKDASSVDDRSCDQFNSKRLLTMEMDKEKKYHSKISPAFTCSLRATLRSANRNEGRPNRDDLTSAMRASNLRRCRRRRRRWRFWFAVRPVSSSYWSSSELITSNSRVSMAEDDSSDVSVSSAVKGSCSSHFVGTASPCGRRLSSLRSEEAGCNARLAPVSTELRRRW